MKYPEPICQDCGEDCLMHEEVEICIVTHQLDLWCYCVDCDLETFHPINYDYNKTAS